MIVRPELRPLLSDRMATPLRSFYPTTIIKKI